jgi:ATP-binding cassette, subfamily B, bacterial PglK
VKQYISEVMFLLGDERKIFFGMIFFFLISSLLDVVGIGLIGPYVALMVYDGTHVVEGGIFKEVIEFVGLPKKKEPLLVWLGLSLVFLFFLKSTLAILIESKITNFAHKQQLRLKCVLMQSYQNLPYTEFLNRNSAEYILAIQTYTGSFSGVIEAGLKTVGDGFVGLAIFIMLAWVNGPALATLVLLMGGLVFAYDRIFKRKILRYGKLTNEAGINMVKGVHEGIEGLKEIRILGKEDYFFRKVQNAATEYADNVVKHQIVSIMPRYFLEFILISFIVSLVVTTILIGHNIQALIPTLSIFGVAAMRLMPSANLFAKSLIQFRFNRHGVSQLYKDSHAIMNKQKALGVLSEKTNNKVVFDELMIEAVSFFYPNINISALKNITLRIRAGDSIGFIGVSGAGKTTLVDLLLGLLKPQSGDIYFNGKPMSDLIGQWRSQVAYLPQQVFLIDSTMRQNVALGVDEDDIDDELLHQVLKQVRLQELVDQLPQGVETLLGERGVRLSGGQRQRVALARAFYHGREVIVMDEATSSIDNETEEEIVNEILQLKGKKTMIVIAHRLTTLRHCDQIYRLDNGKIIEHGTYEEINKL